MKLIFNSRMLQKHLASIQNAKVSIIVAPTGYGKSVLIKQLQAQTPNMVLHVHQVHSQDLMTEWASLCDTIAVVSPKRADELRECVHHGLLDTNRAAQLMDDFKSTSGRNIYLVIDDFFKLLEFMPLNVLSSMFRPKSADLHLILVGHPFQMPYSIEYDPYAIYWVSARDLLFNMNDIKEYFSLNGAGLSDEDADRIYKATNGWPAGVRACLEQALAGRKPDPVAITRRLLSQVSLDRLSQQELHILMGLAFLDNQGKNAISFFVDPENLQRAVNRLHNVPLMYLDDATQGWKMHETLREFMLLRLQNSPLEDRQDVFSRLSKYLLASGRLPEALGCLYQVKDYEAILTQDLKLLQFEDCLGTPSQVIARNVIEHCPLDIKARHRLSVLRLAYLLFCSGDFAGYHLALIQTRSMITPESEMHLYGEWLIRAC